MNKALRTSLIISGSTTLVTAISAVILLLKADKHFTERLSFRNAKLSLCGEM